MKYLYLNPEEFLVEDEVGDIYLAVNVDLLADCTGIYFHRGDMPFTAEEVEGEEDFEDPFYMEPILN